MSERTNKINELFLYIYLYLWSALDVNKAQTIDFNSRTEVDLDV
jgi:hypothetical protein